jgi:SAM-dependent methyltransferase
MKLYGALAEWWPLLSPPSDYEEEAEYFMSLFRQYCEQPPRTMLELGSGGGNTASHLKKYANLTLVDLSPGMLDISRKLNADCEHVRGDMRTVQLGRIFDCVFVHDAVMYMTNTADLRSAISNTYAHSAPGGAAIFSPDCVRETFSPDTGHGGSDSAERSLRYLEWSWDPDPSDNTFMTDYTVVMRDGQGEARVMQERHEMGLFSGAEWEELLEGVGFSVIVVPDKWGRRNFVGKKAA